jgi:hypothetical protein
MATGQLKCDECKNIIEHGERYMLDGEEGKEHCWCLACCKKKSEAEDVKEKGEKYVTFFPRSKFDK